MRICLYSETVLPKLGGQEVVIDTLARQFQQAGHEVVVLAPYPRSSLRIQDCQLPYPVFRHPRFFSTRYFVDCYRYWLLQLYRRFRFDILHCHGIYPAGYLAARCRPQLTVPVVITSHGGDIRPDGIRQAKPVVRRRQFFAVREADGLISLSPFTRQGFLYWGADPSRIVSIPNGVHPEPLANPVARPESLDGGIQPGAYGLYLGRLVHRKGVDLALQALKFVQPTGKVQLVVAGGGEEMNSLKQLTTQLRVEDRVHFTGPTFGNTKNYLLQNALCTILPSRFSEAFPLVLLESFAASTPALGTRVPGLEDLIKPIKNGWLVPPESPEALAMVLQNNFRQPDRCHALGRRAAEGAESFSWNRIAQQHLNLYEDLIGSRLWRRTLIPSSFC